MFRLGESKARNLMGMNYANSNTVIALSLPAVYFLGAAFPPQLVLLLMPRHAPPPPDKDDPRGQAMMNEVEAEAQNLPVVERMRAKEDWYETSE